MENEIYLTEKINPALSVYHCGYQLCERSHFYGPAVRDHYLIHYILNGSGEYTVYGKTYKLNKGDGFLILPDDTTVYRASDTDPWEYCWVGFNGATAKEMLKAAGLDKNNLIFTYNKDRRLENSMRSLNEAIKFYSAAEFAMLGYLYIFFSCLIENNMKKKSPLSFETHLNKAVRYIQGNYSRELTINELANFVGLNRSHLFKLFKKYLNKSPEEYLIEYRMKRACELLCESELNVSETAYSAGFKNPDHFSKLFKKLYSVSPREYRKIYRDAGN